jgi:hypothetical protein
VPLGENPIATDTPEPGAPDPLDSESEGCAQTLLMAGHATQISKLFIQMRARLARLDLSIEIASLATYAG